MHGIIISPMIYNVKRIYICLSDIFKLFQDFSREIQTIIRPHTNSHTILRFTTKRHKRGKKTLQPYSARFLFLLVYIDEAHAARITLHVFSCKLCLSIMRHDAIYMFFL